MTHEDHPTTPPFPPGPPAPPQQGTQQWPAGPGAAPLPPQHGAPSHQWDQPPTGPGAPGGPPGGPGGWNQPAPARPGSSWTLVAAAVTGVVGLALGAGIGFLVWGGDDEDSSASSPTSSAPESEAAESTDEPTEEPAEADATDEPSSDASTEPADDVETIAPPAPSGRSGEGSSDAPLAFGETVTTEDWEVTLGAPVDATDAVMAENQFNSPPAEGSAFYTLPVTATYLGDETGVAWIDLTAGFVGADGVATVDGCGVVPGDLMDVEELATGEVAEGNLCVAVPVDADGQWSLMVGWTEDPVFFAAP